MAVAAVSFCLLSVAAYGLAPWLLEILSRPLDGRSLIYLSPLEGMMARIKLSLAMAFTLSLPLLFFWLFKGVGGRWALLNARLRPTLAMVAASSLFCLGMAFAWWAVLPASLRFLLEAGGDVVVPLLSVDSYVTFMLTIAFSCGFAFQMPLVVMVLSRMGLMSAEAMRRQRRAAILAILIVVAFLTPTPDAVTLTLVALPLIALFELGIVLAAITVPARPLMGRAHGGR